MSTKKLGSIKLSDTLLVTSVNLASEVTGTLGVANGGTGQTVYTDGQLLIGNTTGNTLTKATLTQGSGVTITNGGGSITIAATAISSQWTTSGSDIYYNTGNVGLGISTPGAKLHLYQNAATNQQVRTENSLASWIAGVDTSGNYTIYSNNSNVIYMSTAGTERLRIDSSGNVGIGAAPGAFKLDVTGAARITGATTLNSIAYTWPATQTANYYLQTNGTGTLSWAAPAADPWTVIKLASDYTTTSATLATITDGTNLLRHRPNANTVTEYEAMLIIQTSVATNNPLTAFAWATSLTDGVAQIFQTGSGVGTLVYQSGNIAATVQIPAGGLPAATTSYAVRIFAMTTAGATAPGGFNAVQMAAETAGGTMTVKAGSFIRYRTL